MFRWLKRRDARNWGNGWDDGYHVGRVNTLHLILKRFERMEKQANTTPNLYTLEDIRAVIEVYRD